MKCTYRREYLMKRILVIDDEAGTRESLKLVLSDRYKIVGAESARAGVEAIKKNLPDLVFLDVLMPDKDGLEALAEIRAIDPDIPVVMLTAVSRIDTAVKAIKAGATDYLTKPFDVEGIRLLTEKIFRETKLRERCEFLKNEIEREFNLSEIVYRSEKMAHVMEVARTAAVHDSPVLITGETGTGKELLARFIHRESQRSREPFVAIHCAAIPETLFESELFGYERGAFTGAFKSKPGRLEVASGGTVFFDEIGEMPISLQVKLLRVLQEREFLRIGSNETIPLDVRVVAATSRDLKSEINHGAFREDLFYRLSVIPVEIPPLRERREDILPIAEHFIRFFASQMNAKARGLSPGAGKLFTSYDWPGNVREVRNIIERILVLRGDKVIIDTEDLPVEMGAQEKSTAQSAGAFFERVQEFERRIIIDALKRNNWNQTRASESLNMSRRILGYKIKKYGICAGKNGTTRAPGISDKI